jgi:hypothetical protein
MAASAVPIAVLGMARTEAKVIVSGNLQRF